MTICCVPSCKNYFSRGGSSNSGLMFHRFLKINKEVQKKWILFCDNDKVSVNASRICSAHFSDSDYTEDMKARLLYNKISKKLNPGAIPSKRTYCKKKKTTIKYDNDRKSESPIDEQDLKGIYENETDPLRLSPEPEESLIHVFKAEDPLDLGTYVYG